MPSEFTGGKLTLAIRMPLSHPRRKAKARLQEAKESGTHSGVRWWASFFRCVGRRKEQRQAWGCGRAGREHCSLGPCAGVFCQPSSLYPEEKFDRKL